MKHPIPDAALDAHLAVLGTSGYGKTNAIKGAVERLLARGERVVIVDPTGVWWGLRLSRDGRKPSPYPLVIFGGRHADLPLDETQGERLAKVLGTSTTPAILDTQLMSVAARTRFFTDFAEAILRENRGPLHLVLDEAHLFAPQSGGHGLVPALLHATNNLVALGRAAGLSVVLITQRSAKLHKDSLSQIATLVLMGLLDPRDQDAAEAWLRRRPRAQEIMDSLPNLPIGTGWIYAPRLGALERAAFPLVTTYDSGRPEANADAPALKPLDVAALREALAAAAPAPSEAGGAPKGRGSEASAALARPASAIELAAAERSGYERGLLDGEARGIERGAHAGWKAAATCLQRDLDGFLGSIGSPRDHDNGEAEIAKALGLAAWPEAAARAPATVPAVRAPARAAACPNGHTPASGALPPAKRRILDALAWLGSIGQTSSARNVVAFIAEASSRSSSYANNVSALRTAGLIDYPGDGLLALTAEGRAHAVTPERRLDHAATMSALASKLAPAQMRILQAAVQAHPKPLSREALAAGAEASPTSSAFANNVSRLSSLGLVTYPASGAVRAADLLFPGSPR